MFDATTNSYVYSAPFSATTVIAPTVSGRALSVALGQAVALAPYIATTNPSGDSITAYWVEDLGTGGNLATGGVTVAKGQWLQASSQWSNVQYVGGSSSGTDTLELAMYDATIGTFVYSTLFSATTVGPSQVHSDNLSYAASASGANHFIDLPNFEASFGDLIKAFGSNMQAMSAWYSTFEPLEHRVAAFDGLDYIASYRDLIQVLAPPGSSQTAVEDIGAMHYITNGLNEGRTTTFNGLDYIASYKDLIKVFGANSDAGAMHFITYGINEGRTTTFDGLDYIASYKDLIAAFGANEQSGAAHFINNGNNEGRTTTFDGLSYIAQYSDLMMAFGANNDAGASHYITNGVNEGRSTSFNVQAYETAHPDLKGVYATNDQFLAAYINTYVQTGHYLV
jgi:hypothetical protein